MFFSVVIKIISLNEKFTLKEKFSIDFVMFKIYNIIQKILLIVFFVNISRFYGDSSFCLRNEVDLIS